LTFLALGLAAATTVGVIVFVQATRSTGDGGGGAPGKARVGDPAPNVIGTTLDGASFDLASLRGRPVIVNFWGPSCVPCRDEFPLFSKELAAHGGEGLAVVGVLFLDDVPSARQFASDFHATWPTVVDPGKVAATAYRVVARPQSYFIDRAGVLRSIQVGQVTEADFARQFDTIVK
jgi:cytochrome c biogenesis protein CcmG/thiol:disulfide interchange protein DsbE